MTDKPAESENEKIDNVRLLHPNMSVRKANELAFQNKMAQLNNEMNSRETKDRLKAEARDHERNPDLFTEEVDAKIDAMVWEKVAKEEGINLDEYDRKHGVIDEKGRTTPPPSLGFG